MKSLKLFNVVLVRPSAIYLGQSKEAIKLGLIITPRAAYATTEIINFYRGQLLTGEQFNSTFHKSFGKVLSSSRAELFLHQVLHYITTYGFDELGIYDKDTVYIPNERLEIPTIIANVPLKVIDAVTPEQLTERCFDLLTSGIALKQDTITDVLEILAGLKYQFTSTDLLRVKNKEAKMHIIKALGIMPTDPVEFVRYLVWKATGKSLLIKDGATIAAITASECNIEKDIINFGAANAAQVFNRFKPLFLAFKKVVGNGTIINRVSQLSKKYHVPMKEDILAQITSNPDIDMHKLNRALGNATSFRKISILNAINSRLSGTSAMMYRIRNGKSFVKDSPDIDRGLLVHIKQVVYNSLLNSLDVEGKVIKVTKGVKLAAPTSEKMFVGNLPTGTSINLKSDLIAGIYWEDVWGARDLDLSGMSLDKIGWNADFYNKSGTAVFSGDITRAENGASEVFYVKQGLSHPMLMVNNIYSGEIGCKFKIFVGHESVNGNLDKNYTVDPNNVLLEVDTEMDAKQSIVGIFLPEKDGSTSFVLVNTGFGNVAVSRSGGMIDKAKEFFVKSHATSLSLNRLLADAGATVTTKSDILDERVDIDLTVDNLAKDTIIGLFK